MRLVRRAAVLPLTLALLTAAACSAPTPPAGSAPQQDDTFVIALSAEFESLNPMLGYSPDGGSLIYDGLMSRAADLSMQPALASAAPTTAEDGKTVTFTLRDGVKFHDGRPLTSADVEYTYETMLDPKSSSPIAGDYAAIKEVEAPDATTVVFKLAYPYAPLVQRTTLGIVPKGSPLEGTPPGTGPYRFGAWTPGDKVTFSANAEYWGGAPAIKNVVVAFAEDDNVRATRMKAGEFDATILPPKVAAPFRTETGVKVYDVASADYRGIMFPMKEPVTGDLAVRKAFSLAMDRQAMVDTILAGAGVPAFGPLPTESEWNNPEVTGAGASDTAAAGKVLDEAGWKPGPDGVRVKDGKRAEFTLMYPAGDSLRKELALAAASDATKVGLDVKPAGLDWDAIEPRMSKDALMMGWGSPFDPDYINYELFHSKYAGKGYFNPGLYDNPKVDEALDKARESGDKATRKAAYAEFQKLIFDDHTWSFLVFLKHVYVVRGDWVGPTPGVDAHEHATGGLFRDLHTWKPAA
ncbi:peptide/nickel transport system substrate-binding protein [Sinosporangium album]|uniref:Peptide/nickel transport system substrate-binding protein n=1 Tax=Sinosporangium album TaxID=504805 RepID=A0A1G7QWC8_9ACTN|nr:ABC transporter substrate-binding protein [Sinosporangium album]SDG02828.1 peptide/nickel transport system substrate-binding protein [Sinosporangium album]